MRTQPQLWTVNEECGLAKHENTGIEIHCRDGKTLHVQTDPEKYGLDIPMWLIEALARKGKEVKA